MRDIVSINSMKVLVHNADFRSEVPDWALPLQRKLWNCTEVPSGWKVRTKP